MAATSCHAGQRCIYNASNQCWLAGQIHLVTALSRISPQVRVRVSVVTDSESATESADSSESVRVRIRESFAAVSDGFGSSVCESIFTYQVTAFKRHV